MLAKSDSFVRELGRAVHVALSKQASGARGSKAKRMNLADIFSVTPAQDSYMPHARRLYSTSYLLVPQRPLNLLAYSGRIWRD